MFEKIIETLFWLKIVASPLLLGLIIGVVFKIYLPNDFGTLLFILFTISGLIVGVFWANKIKKKSSPSEFYSRANASPDIDEAMKSKK